MIEFAVGVNTLKLVPRPQINIYSFITPFICCKLCMKLVLLNVLDFELVLCKLKNKNIFKKNKIILGYWIVDITQLKPTLLSTCQGISSEQCL